MNWKIIIEKGSYGNSYSIELSRPIIQVVWPIRVWASSDSNPTAMNHEHFLIWIDSGRSETKRRRPAAAPLDSGTFFLLHPLPSSRIHRSDQATSAGRLISLSSDLILFSCIAIGCRIGYALISDFTAPPARKWLSCSENTLD